MRLNSCANRISICVFCFVFVAFQPLGWVQAQQPQQNNYPQNNQSYPNQRIDTQRQEHNRTVSQNPEQIQAAISQLQQPQVPEGFPLDAESQKWVDDLLLYWEQESEKVKAYKCTFRRWHYMPQFLNYRDPATHKLAARMVTDGEIRFAKPGRGRYDVNQVYHFNAPTEEGQQPQYLPSENQADREKERETWITDGKAIYEFDYINSRLNELELPPEMQGEGLKNSPLPFVFGAKAADLKSRFWIRPMIPEGLPEGYYMIEAIPKTLVDARSYSKVQIVLSQKPFLPVRVELFSVNYSAKTNPESVVLFFENRKINDALQLANNWLKKWFSKPATPFGWERFQGKVGQETNTNQFSNSQNGQGQNYK